MPLLQGFHLDREAQSYSSLTYKANRRAAPMHAK